MTKFKEFLEDEKGDALVSTIFVAFIVFSLFFFCLYRGFIFNVQSHISEEAERSLNIAVKQAMQDGRRLDEKSYIDTYDTKNYFFESLVNDMGLNKNFEMIADGQKVYSLEIKDIEVDEDEARAKAKIVASYTGNFGFFKKEVNIPINIKSKNMRLKEYE